MSRFKIKEVLVLEKKIFTVFVPMAEKTKRYAVTCNGNESVGTQ